MYLAIKYYVEILERLWCDDYGLGQVFPTYYIALQHMYEEQKALKEKLKTTTKSKSKVAIGSHNIIRRKGLSLE